MCVCVYIYIWYHWAILGIRPERRGQGPASAPGRHASAVAHPAVYHLGLRQHSVAPTKTKGPANHSWSRRDRACQRQTAEQPHGAETLRVAWVSARLHHEDSLAHKSRVWWGLQTPDSSLDLRSNASVSPHVVPR